MASFEGLEAWDDESLDDESFDDESLDDESVDDESELLEQLLGGPASLIGNALGGLFGGNRQPSRPPLPRVAPGAYGNGVSTATLNTPAGNATLRLPEPVVTRKEFEDELVKIRRGLERDRSRLNVVGKDLDGLRTSVATAVTETQKSITRVRSDLVKTRRATRASIARLKADQSSQQMMTMVMSMMSQRQLQDQLNDHRHDPVTGAVINPGGTDDNSMMMMLPFMMSGSGGSDNMMLPMMMLAMR